MCVRVCEVCMHMSLFLLFFLPPPSYEEERLTLSRGFMIMERDELVSFVHSSGYIEGVRCSRVGKCLCTTARCTFP